MVGLFPCNRNLSEPLLNFDDDDGAGCHLAHISMQCDERKDECDCDELKDERGYDERKDECDCDELKDERGYDERKDECDCDELKDERGYDEHKGKCAHCPDWQRRGCFGLCHARRRCAIETLFSQLVFDDFSSRIRASSSS